MRKCKQSINQYPPAGHIVEDVDMINTSSHKGAKLSTVFENL